MAIIYLILMLKSIIDQNDRIINEKSYMEV